MHVQALLVSVLLSVLTGAAVACPALAEAVGPPDREHALDTLIRRMDHYVLQERKPAVVARLRAERARYLGIEDAHAFAQALSADLLAASGDKHLQVWVEQPPPTPALASGPPPSRETAEAARGHGLAAVRRLPGNVGYLRLNSFSGAPGAVGVLDAAMALLAPTDALIIDLRDNGGGGEASLNRLTAHFFPQRVHIGTLAWRECSQSPQDRPDACERHLAPRVVEQWSDALPAPAYPSKPVHILLSRNSFSAAEHFAYAMQQEGRATLVGETTGGGANPSASMDLGDRFTVIMPIGLSKHPKSGGNWEGVGVKPDVAVTADRALIEAYRRSLSAIPFGGDPGLNAERTAALADLEPTLRRETAM